MSSSAVHSFLLSGVLALCLLVQQSAAQGQNLVFCEDKPCFHVFNGETCEEIVEKLVFQGSYCNLVDIPESRSCRVVVKAGNCAWYAKCGDCPASYECLIERQSNNMEDLVLNDEYNVVFPTMAPTRSPVADGESMSPTMAPIVVPETTCPPTFPPVDGGNVGNGNDDGDGGDNDDSANALLGTTAVVLMLVSSVLVSLGMF